MRHEPTAEILPAGEHTIVQVRIPGTVRLPEFVVSYTDEGVLFCIGEFDPTQAEAIARGLSLFAAELAKGTA